MYGDKLKWCVIARNSVKECKTEATFANIYELGTNYVAKMLAILKTKKS